MTSGAVLPGYYDFRLVALSVIISIMAAAAALDSAERVTTARGKSHIAWLGGGATAMGIGIWAMHYVGMLAFHLSIRVRYDWLIVLLSLIAAVAASGIALYLVSRATMGLVRACAGSVFMGAGIAGMHYIGMMAMRLKATMVYSPVIVTLSVVLAVVISFFALELAFAHRHDSERWGWRKMLSALVMGLAIPIMHYVGMAAVTFYAAPALPVGLARVISISNLGLTTISAATLLILVQVSAVAMVDRRLAFHAQQVVHGQLQLQTIFDNMQEGIAVLDRTGHIVQMNQAAASLLGLPNREIGLDEVEGLLDAYTSSGDLIPAHERPGARALRGDFVNNYEIGLRPRNSTSLAIAELNTAPIPVPGGETEQIIISYRDITERKRTEEARARLVAIVESSEDAIVGKDLDGVVTAWSRGAEKLYGYTAEEMIGKHYRIVLPEGRENEEAETQNRILRGEVVEHAETVRQRKSGEVVHVSITASPIRNARGEIVGVSKIVRDITAKRLLERQLRQSQKMEALGQLTGGIAHDFNNLLGVIMGNLDLLDRTLDSNERARKRVETAQRAATRGADLTRRLLAFSSKEELNPVSISLQTVIQELLELAGRTLGPEIKITSHCDDPELSVFADVTGLESALLNLVLNARDAMPKGGSLVLRTSAVELEKQYPLVMTDELASGRYACIAVSDSGPGMSKATMERAFEPFFTTKPRHKGTGLGLAMVYGFMKQSGGAVRLYSEEGYGTTVSLYLPLPDSEDKVVCSAPPVQIPATLGGTALVVDDELPLLEIAHAYLADLGFTVLEAEDSNAALNILRGGAKIDLLVTDIIMPGKMNGIDLAQAVGELQPGVRVVYTSGFPAEALAERSGKLVVGPLLRKPYLRAEFVTMIHSAMGLQTEPTGTHWPTAQKGIDSVD